MAEGRLTSMVQVQVGKDAVAAASCMDQVWEADPYVQQEQKLGVRDEDIG